MSRRSLIWPLSLIAAFSLLMILLIVGALPTPTSAQKACPDPIYPDQTVAQCQSTQTAYAKTQAAGPAYPAPTNTSAPAQVSSPLPTATSTITPTSTTRPPTATSTIVPSATATRQVPQGSPTPTATSPLNGLETITCAPGATVSLTGRSSPHLALLAYFNDRPVGGTLARGDGSYQILLRVGDERPGTYAVDVRERDSRDVVRELACQVPGATPTPTIPLIP